MKFRLPQAYFSKIMRAIVEFEMIERGDNILIGLSGGKDSLLLTYALAMMRERTKGKFSLRALTIDPLFSEDFDAGYSPCNRKSRYRGSDSKQSEKRALLYLRLLSPRRDQSRRYGTSMQ